MTGGKIAGRLPALDNTPQWNGLHFSRIRRTDDESLRTTGHTQSQSARQVRDALQDHDTSEILLLDDTSFSGTTNALAEHTIRSALPEREVNITHGFLIANEGELGPGVPGALGRLGVALVGHRMCTPRDDGWHIFDIVQQPNLENHLLDVQHALHHPECEEKLFAGGISSEELRLLQAEGKFVAANAIEGKWHIKNPQLLPRIIKAGHVEPIKNWNNEDEVFATLLRMGEIVKGKE